MSEKKHNNTIDVTLDEGSSRTECFTNRPLRGIWNESFKLVDGDKEINIAGTLVEVVELLRSIDKKLTKKEGDK